MDRELDQSQIPIQVDSSDRSCPSNSDHVIQAKKLLFRRMLVGIKDGRFFLGGFYCLDKQGNIILQDAVEYRSTHRSSPSPMEQRCLGLILIPSSCRTSCHVDCSVDEQLSLLSLKEKKLHTDIDKFDTVSFMKTIFSEIVNEDLKVYNVSVEAAADDWWPDLQERAVTAVSSFQHICECVGKLKDIRILEIGARESKDIRVLEMRAKN